MPLDPLIECAARKSALTSSGSGAAGLIAAAKTAEEGKQVILLEIELDEGICSILDYFEIFLQRMLMCKRAAEMLGMKFKMKANGNKIC